MSFPWKEILLRSFQAVGEAACIRLLVGILMDSHMFAMYFRRTFQNFQVSPCHRPTLWRGKLRDVFQKCLPSVKCPPFWDLGKRQLLQLLCRNLAASSSIYRHTNHTVLQVGYGWPLGARRAQSFPFEAVPLGCSIHGIITEVHPFFGHSVALRWWPKSSKILMNRVAFEQISLHSPAVLPIQSVLQCWHVFPAYLVSIFLGRWNSLDLSVMHRKNFWRESSRCFPCFPLRWSDGTSWAWSICTTMPWWWNVTSLFCISCDERNWWKTGKHPRKTHGKAQDFRVHARSQW